MFDIIGDIHGYADELKDLLVKLGYEQINGYYAHPERKAIFVGDYINRGPKIIETLEIVKSMTENNSAIALMGNHEYNAICFQFENKIEGGHLRKHQIKNIIQHYETLAQFLGREDEYEIYLKWFMQLPLYYETEQFRVVHACWDDEYIDYLKNTLDNGKLNESQIYESVNEATFLHEAVEITLKGKELKLPSNVSLLDHEKNSRTEMRIKWWVNPLQQTYKSISVKEIPGLTDDEIEKSNFKSLEYYGNKEKPVFFGHYCLGGNPVIIENNVCCVDYCVANNGKLVAYRYNNESVLDSSNFVFVESGKLD